MNWNHFLDVRAPIESDLTKSRAVTLSPEILELKKLDKMISEWVMLPQAFGEDFVLRRFKPGDSYSDHVDYFDEFSSDVPQRVLTVVVFLDSPIQGGDVHFPGAELTVHPENGAALLYYNKIPNGQVDVISTHRVSHVLEGEKWTLTKFYREKPSIPEVGDNGFIKHLTIN